MKFNINDIVKVRLTDKGRDELRAQHEDLQLFVTSIRPYEAPKEDEQGYSTWKFWTLLQMFGDVMCGGDEYFEPEIILVDIPILEQQERGDGEWIEWGGGECPVAPWESVSVKHRNDKCTSPDGPAYQFDWSNYPSKFDTDIIAYRIIPEQPTNQNGEQ